MKTPNWSKNSILVFKEKHGERNFICPTQEDLYKAALIVFKDRDGEGYWYDFEDIKEPTKPDISKEEAPRLKNNDLKVFVLNAWIAYEGHIKYNKEDLENKRLYDLAKKDEKGPDAWAFLKFRRGGEYEGCEIIEAEEI